MNVVKIADLTKESGDRLLKTLGKIQASQDLKRCVSTLLSSIGNSDVLGFANLALESEAWLQERRTNGSAGGVGYGGDL
ncbi:hypothetical protein TNCV_1116331 [Trichonephila clavipes]|nr:hypothetical protein TNCV_1116331 [Trichonephila clavipes]